MTYSARCSRLTERFITNVYVMQLVQHVTVLVTSFDVTQRQQQQHVKQ